MPIGYSQLPELLPVPGVRLSAVAAGIRYQGRNDLVLMELADKTRVAAVFTRNAFCAAPGCRSQGTHGFPLGALFADQ